MAVKQQQSPEEVDREFNRIVGEEFRPNQNPIQAGYEKTLNNPSSNLHAQERQAAERATANTLGGEGLEPSKQSIEQAKEAEERADTLGNKWNNNYTGDKLKGNKVSLKDRLKRSGPMGAIISMLFFGGAGFSIMLAPGLGLVHLSEIFINDLNDQLAAAEIKGNQLFRAKLKGLQAGFSICSNTVSVRCKFGTMSGNTVKNLQAAGFTI
jgi:hypothetical protein